MKLNRVQIKNYRSIEDIAFEIEPLDDKSFTYGLIGVNEAGKSSILKSMALKDGLIKLTPKDFKDKTILEVTILKMFSPQEQKVFSSAYIKEK